MWEHTPHTLYQTGFNQRRRTSKRYKYTYINAFVTGNWSYIIAGVNQSLNNCCAHIWCQSSESTAQAFRKGKWVKSDDPLARARISLGLKSCLIGPDLGDKVILHMLGPFFTGVNIHIWPRSDRSWWLILRKESRPSCSFTPMRWMSWWATMCTCAAKVCWFSFAFQISQESSLMLL